MSRLQPHAVVERWHTGGFDKIYHLRCRCGKMFTSRWARQNAVNFQAHKAEKQAEEQQRGDQP